MHIDIITLYVHSVNRQLTASTISCYYVHRMVKKEIIKEYRYRPVLAAEAREPLLALADSLGFRVNRQGTYHGEPSVRDFLHALAAAYERDPAGVRLALKVLGVTPDGTPTYTSE